MRFGRRIQQAGVVLAGLVWASHALAKGPPDEDFDDADLLSAAEPADASPEIDPLIAFPYVEPQEPHYVRAAIELFAVLAIGQVDYLLNTQARGGISKPGDRRWDLRYSWPEFQEKLTGDAYTLDTNKFNTNYIAHPFAGTLYYTAARANHLTVAESVGFAFTASAMWEYFGELREPISINDAIVTPLSGAAIGEPMMQFGGYFQQGKKSIATDVLAFILAPSKVLNDWADGGEPLRSSRLDAFGFSRDAWHRFSFFVGGGATLQPSEAAGGMLRGYADTRAGFDLELARLPGYRDVGFRSDAFGDGNASKLGFDIALSGSQLVDAQFRTEVMPAGYHYRSAAYDLSGGVHGEGLLFGLRSAFEYGVHDYDRDRARPIDLVALVSPIGVVGEYARDTGRFGIRTRVDVGGSFAGVKFYALGVYRAASGDANLQTVLAREGYYHALGLSVGPTIALTFDNLEFVARSRFDAFNAIAGFDELQASIVREIPVSDRRVLFDLGADYRFPNSHWVLGAHSVARGRFGDVGDARASQRELSLFATFGIRL